MEADFRLSWNALIALKLLQDCPDRAIVSKIGWARKCSQYMLVRGREISHWRYYRSISKLPETVVTKHMKGAAWQFHLQPMADDILAGRAKVWLWRLAPYEGPEHLAQYLDHPDF